MMEEKNLELSELTLMVDLLSRYQNQLDKDLICSNLSKTNEDYNVLESKIQRICLAKDIVKQDLNEKLENL